MKVSELEGAELDAWVAKAHGMVSMEYPIAKGKPLTQFWGYDKREGVHAGPRVAVAKFKPSTDWIWGGPILDDEKIGVHFSVGEFWVARTGEGGDPDAYCVGRGPTILVAAMRAYVASKYGEEVPND